MNRLLLICLFLAASMASFAQGTVKGRVLDKQTNEVLQFVNVSVRNATTGKMVKGSVTDAKGHFNIGNLAYGDYQLTVSYVGYKNINRKFSLSKENPRSNFPVLYLAEDHQVLKEVQVTGQRSQMKLEVDRKTFSVDQVLAEIGRASCRERV